MKRTTRVYICVIATFLTVVCVSYVLTGGQETRSRPVVHQDSTADVVMTDKNADASSSREPLQPTSSAPDDARGGASVVAPAAEPNTVPERLRVIFQTNGAVSFNERLAAVHSLDIALTAAEIEALYRFLLSYDRDSLVKNDILNLLRSQQNRAAGLMEILTTVYEDRQQDPPLRDYAVQHAALSYDPSTVQDRERIEALLWSAAGESNSAIAGTALLGLLRIGAGRTTVDSAKIADIALNIAANRSANDLARTTAIQVCGRLGQPRALATAKMLSDSTESISLRMAAIATLGDAGDSSQAATLRRLAAEPEARIQRAAESALERLSRNR